eukprot:359539-Chlamydomonas_euryale.AAC.3
MCIRDSICPRPSSSIPSFGIGPSLMGSQPLHPRPLFPLAALWPTHSDSLLPLATLATLATLHAPTPLLPSSPVPSLRARPAPHLRSTHGGSGFRGPGAGGKGNAHLCAVPDAEAILEFRNADAPLALVDRRHDGVNEPGAGMDAGANAGVDTGCRGRGCGRGRTHGRTRWGVDVGMGAAAHARRYAARRYAARRYAARRYAAKLTPSPPSPLGGLQQSRAQKIGPWTSMEKASAHTRRCATQWQGKRPHLPTLDPVSTRHGPHTAAHGRSQKARSRRARCAADRMPTC